MSADSASAALICGDNLAAMKAMDSESVALIYLDPPFQSGKEWRGSAGSQAEGAEFSDSWKGRPPPGELADCLALIPAFASLHDLARRTQGAAMAAYLQFMGVRLLEMRRLLKPDGSIFLHCDQSASHYLKALMDAVFGAANFKNEIVWKRCQAKGNASRRFPVIADSIFLYGKSAAARFNPIFVPYDPAYVKKFYRYKDDRGLHWRGDASSQTPAPHRRFAFKGYPPPAKGWAFSEDRMERLHAEGRLYLPPNKNGRIAKKIYLHERKGFPVQSIWTDLPFLAPADAERTGYPTQKPERLLRRIIESASDPLDVVLDPFCGSGTACAAAEALGRGYIGIDSSRKAIDVAQSRLGQTAMTLFKPSNRGA